MNAFCEKYVTASLINVDSVALKYTLVTEKLHIL